MAAKVSAYSGNLLRRSFIGTAIVNGTILKTIIEVLLFPVANLLVAKIKDAEGIEFFDKVIVSASIKTTA